MTTDPFTLPPLNYAALSPEHHLLRVLVDEEPTDLETAITRVLKRSARAGTPYLRFGQDPARPTSLAYRTWENLGQESWTRSVRRGARHGYVLTGTGEIRLSTLWDLQVIAPHLRAVRAEHGDEVAQRVAAHLEGQS
ncbi:hypothetical protein [Deinococcus radiotolerans]|uniref:Uncharacterized protein n=1 Tax=Deinococcus radiotolerans TaxID=1309407 RepID=A0ABQ2FQC7_9DEIO|nr:hypothetical protein [Deinococcus radiotolerans]GGL16552.1 hypothetical protein GCM10010844_39300 [Deinococcus radiotolerans]